MGYTTFTNGTQPALSDTILNNMQVELMKLVFPIGSTYITQTNTNPSEILKFGTWERVKGKVLVGLDEDDTDFNTIGKIGGEKEHTLTVDEMPQHSHTFNKTSGTANYKDTGSGTAYGDYLVNTSSAGGDQPHNNLQPYQVVGYMWRRTA